MSKDGKRIEQPSEVIDFTAARAARTEMRTPEQRTAREITREAILAATTSREPGHILEAWKVLEAQNATGTIPRAGLRRMDLHLATISPDIIEYVARKDASARHLVNALATQTQGGHREPEAAPVTFNRIGPFVHLADLSERAGGLVVESDANNRTEDEHRRARLGVEVALLSTRMDQLLYTLKNGIGATLGNKLTVLEKAALNDHIERILHGGHWSHPTQEIANTFATWESILGTFHNSGAVAIVPEPASFRPKETARPEHKEKPRVELLKNIANAPRDAWNEFVKLLDNN